ncbi:MAG: histidine phosphatase family protein [Anaerolineae bacterium]|jgi:2,3-bisphosphoglycerate-dependent phosphoglycerate mutase
MRFYFIRHAQSENNRLWAETGTAEGRRIDPTLTGVGERQVERLAALLARPGQEPAVPYDPQDVAGFDITHLYCSLMVRAVATGLVLARALDVPLVAWEEIHETGGIHHYDPETGVHTGLPGPNRAYFEAHYPELSLPEALGEAGWWDRPFEERADRHPRARRFFDDLLARHGGSDDRVAIISHGGFYNHFMRVVLGLPEDIQIWFSLDNTAISSFEFGPEYWWVRYLNRTDHLPPELIT